MRYPDDFFPGGADRPVPAAASVVIVGGGLAGLELAKELQRRGARDVVVLEAGPRGGGVHVNTEAEPVEALEMWLDAENPAELWRPWTSATPPHFTRHGGLRRRLGGRSLYWHGVVLPIEPWALTPPWWPEPVVADLTRSWDGGPGLYDVVRAELTAWRGRPLPADRPPLRIGGRELLPTPKAIRPSGRGWEAYNPISSWTERGGDGITLVTDCTVLGVSLRAGRACGVAFDNSTITGDHVVLAAGTIENTRLAIQARHEAGVGGPVLDGLVDHIEQGVLVVVETDRLPGDLAELALSDSAHHLPCAPGSRTALFTRLYPAPGTDGRLVVLEAYTTGEQERGPHGYVQCTEDTSWPWPTAVHAGLSDRDTHTVLAGREILSEVWHDLAELVGVAPVPPRFPDFRDPARTVSEALREMARGEVPTGEPVAWCSLLGTVDHESGTLPFGDLLGDDQQLLDVPGLYVTGPAVFPRCGAANPSLTTLALSRRLSRTLAH